MRDIMIIDFHTHTFPDNVAPKALESLSLSGHVSPQSQGTMESLIQSMRDNGIDYSVNLTVMTRVDQVQRVHDKVISAMADMEPQGIITFGGMHPEYEDYRTEIRRLKACGIKGIKIHPAFAKISVSDIRYKRIIAEASEQDMIVITHAGEDISFIGENYASVSDIEDIMKDVAPVKLVLAHMGGWQNWQQVTEYIAGMPLWLDTAFSLGAMHPRPGCSLPYEHQMSSEEFVTLVRKHGADRVLFGTDSPWEKQGEYISQVSQTGLTDDETKLILGVNAGRLLGINQEECL